jgi:hydrogenase nickel incorporation protein HypB
MCSTCGCEQTEGVTITRVGEPEFTPASGALLQTHSPHKTVVELEVDVLEQNHRLAQHNRLHFAAGNMFAINLVSSPGSGKTTLLERTLYTSGALKCCVIEGDQQTMNDANRIAATGVPVVQINTGKGCHLDANMVHHALHKLNPEPGSIVLIENVGNLVCPALFDLGENARVVILSVTEGDDKPLKYPDMFASADVCILNKIDLLPYVEFDVEKCKSYARQVNRRLEFIELSATKGTGMEQWLDWLSKKTEHVPVL